MAVRFLEDESAEINPACRSVALDHGRRTRDVHVLLHGLTNCPLQFRRLGEALHEQGASVLIPRMPYHGFSNVMNPRQKLFTARDMLDCAQRAVDFASELGERVTVTGLSVNAVTAAWLAQENADVHRAVLLAPFFAPKGTPDALIGPLGGLLAALPNTFLWWDPKLKKRRPGAHHSYPRFTTRPIGQTMRIGLRVFRQARRHPPCAQHILIVTTAADMAVNNARTRQLAALWENAAFGRVRTCEFPEEWKVAHDFIDPAQPYQQVDRVYPVLLEQIRKLD